MRRYHRILGLLIVAVATMASRSWAEAEQDCATCHKKESPGLYRQWKAGPHAEAEVECIDCHKAKKSDPDAFTHEGSTIATLVTPKDCGRCHRDEYKEFRDSHHAKAGLILDSKDNFLAGAVAGLPAVITGCESCHGSKVVIDEDSPNKLSKLTYPNTGIGRINPDGSSGSCSACHVRHEFTREQARRPEHCGKCHMGPDHPQKEVYEESKHGIAYRANSHKMKMDKESWVVGIDYWQAPTCATCHMSATKKQQISHDIGKRISWNLRAPVSKPMKESKKKRDAMVGVCTACHSKRHTENFYYSFDGLVNLYNEKFAKPSGAIMKILKKNGSLKNAEGKKPRANFGSDVEWIYWELWHHEGRRARHGASMMGPDYAWWHGMYEVSKHFYFDFIPEVRKLGDAEANKYIDNLLTQDFHKWLSSDKALTAKKLKDGALAKMYEKLFVPPWKPVE